MYRKQHGFTLIELLVVISIIALLVGILLPALGRARLAAQNISGLSQDRQVGTSIYAYSVSNNGYAPTTLGVRWDSIDPSAAAFDAYESAGEIGSALRGGGYALWSGADGSVSDADNENPADAREELGLGHLIDQEFITTEFFFHPVMKEADAGGGDMQDNWQFSANVNDSTTTDSATGITGATGTSVATDPAPSGNTWAGVGYTVHSTLAYRNGDRTEYGASAPVAGDGTTSLTLGNNQIESINFATKALAVDTPIDNQGNRMGGILGYVLGDGSAGHHSTPAFFGGVKDRAASSNNGIVALGAADNDAATAATFAGPYGGLTGGWAGASAMEGDIQTAGYWCHLVDVELGVE